MQGPAHKPEAAAAVKQLYMQQLSGCAAGLCIACAFIDHRTHLAAELCHALLQLLIAALQLAGRRLQLALHARVQRQRACLCLASERAVSLLPGA